MNEAAPSGWQRAGLGRCSAAMPWLWPHPPLPAAARQRLADRTAAGRQSSVVGTSAAGPIAAPSGRGAAGWARS